MHPVVRLGASVEQFVLCLDCGRRYCGIGSGCFWVVGPEPDMTSLQSNPVPLSYLLGCLWKVPSTSLAGGCSGKQLIWIYCVASTGGTLRVPAQ